MMSYAFTLLAVHCGCLGKSKFLDALASLKTMLDIK